LNNPLAHYKNYVESVEKYSEKNHLFLILSPFRKIPEGPAGIYFKEKNDFKLIILSHFTKVLVEKIKIISPSSQNSNLYLNELIQTLQNRTINYKRESLLVSLCESLINYNYKSNSKGGFLELKEKNYVYKIRIEKSNWKIEYWIDGNKMNLIEIELSSDFQYLKKEIDNFINSNQNTIN
tara:strand:+ start:536 stop:1075 length:540 start_codon:yes stop_codon:yes gene_type:complete